jgi:translation initiation factor 1
MDGFLICYLIDSWPRTLFGPSGYFLHKFRLMQNRSTSRSKVSGLSSLGGLVYSTDAGRMCPDCRNPVAQCTCKAQTAVPAGDGIVRVSRETKGRGGKAVTLVKGVLVDASALADLGKQLKAACGSGGTVKDGVIEVQGDHCERVMEWLRAHGHTVKRAGG